MSAIADFAKLLTLFFSRYLMQQRQVSPNTIASYRDTFRLLVNYANKVLGKPPQDLSFEDLDADLIGDFLNHLEHERGNDVRTRNARLAAIRSLFSYVALHEPQHAALAQRVLAIPTKRYTRREVDFLSRAESELSSGRRIGPAGSGDATTACCWWRCRPVCGARRSSPCAAATSALVTALMSAVTARGGRNARSRCAGTRSRRCARG